MPKVTIVTMCHNYGMYLEECVASVRQQTFQDFEHIVVNAGSTDNTHEVASKLPVTLYDISDLGICSSRNYGIARASGEYIVNLDADDKLHPQFLSSLLRFAGPKMIVCPGLQEFGKGSNAGWPTWGLTYDAFMQQNRIFCCSMFPWQLWHAVGGYDPALDWLSCEDWDLWSSMVRAGCGVTVVPELLFYYRVHSNNRTQRCAGSIDEQSRAYIRTKNGVS